MDISFIIPAYNESKNIEHVIHSINDCVPRAYSYEIIVVDHGSSDNTVALAKNSGANVFEHSTGTIAGLRNFGVKNSNGAVLVFLDADILLTSDWSANISGVVDLLSGGKRLLTGSWISIPDHPSWIEKYWFKPLESGCNTHINSGHLIISRKVFDEIDGFDESLETGEDYDISMRAKKAGIQLIDDIRLRAVHEGFPHTLFEFASREFWHGKGDGVSLKAFFQSKVALISIFFLLLHLLLFFVVLNENKIAAYLLLFMILCVVTGIAFIKYRKQAIATILINSGIYYVYFWARALSILSLPAFNLARKRTR